MLPAHASAFSGSDGISGRPPLGDNTPIYSERILIERQWHVPMTLLAAESFVRTHPPAGLVSAGTASGSQAPGVEYDDTVGTRVLGELQIGVSSRGGSTVDMWADAFAFYPEPDIPARDSDTGPRLRITVAGGCPASVRADVDVSSTGNDLLHALLPIATPTGALACGYAGSGALTTSRLLAAPAASDVAAHVRRLFLGPVGTVVCPDDTGTVTIYAFSYPRRPDVDLLDVTGGCSRLSNGVITT